MEKEQLSPFVRKAVDDLNKKKKIFVMLAPSYVVDFKYPDLLITLRQMGFDKICEVTFGARMINKYYHETIKRNPDRMFISTTCPVVTFMVKSRFPQYAKKFDPYCLSNDCDRKSCKEILSKIQYTFYFAMPSET